MFSTLCYVGGFWVVMCFSIRLLEVVVAVLGKGQRWAEVGRYKWEPVGRRSPVPTVSWHKWSWGELRDDAHISPCQEELWFNLFKAGEWGSSFARAERRKKRRLRCWCQTGRGAQSTFTRRSWDTARLGTEVGFLIGLWSITKKSQQLMIGRENTAESNLL